MRSSKEGCIFSPRLISAEHQPENIDHSELPSGIAELDMPSVVAFLEDLHLYLRGRRVPASPRLQPSSCNRRLSGRNWKVGKAFIGEWVQVVSVESRRQIYYCSTMIPERDYLTTKKWKGCVETTWKVCPGTRQGFWQEWVT